MLNAKDWHKHVWLKEAILLYSSYILIRIVPMHFSCYELLYVEWDAIIYMVHWFEVFIEFYRGIIDYMCAQETC